MLTVPILTEITFHGGIFTAYVSDAKRCKCLAGTEDHVQAYNAQGMPAVGRVSSALFLPVGYLCSVST